MLRFQELLDKITGSLCSSWILEFELELIIFEGREISCQKKMQEDSYTPYVLFFRGRFRCYFLKYR